MKKRSRARSLLALAALILLSSSIGWGQVGPDIALQIVSGNWIQAIPGAQVTVCTSAGVPSGNICTPLATVYTDQTLVTPLVQPTIADTNGNYTIFAPAGIYYVCVVNPNVTPNTHICKLFAISTASATTLLLQTNGVANGSQVKQNLKNGTGVAIVDDGVGGVTISAGSPATTLAAGTATSVAGGSGAPATANLNVTTEGTSDWWACNQGPGSSIASFETSVSYTWKKAGINRGHFDVRAFDTGDAIAATPQVNTQTNSPLHISATAGDWARPFGINPNINVGFSAVNGSGNVGGGSSIRIWGAGVSHTYKFYVYINFPSIVTVTAHADDGTASDAVLTATEVNTGAIWSFTYTANIPANSSITVSAIITTNNGTFAGAGFQAFTVF